MRGMIPNILEVYEIEGKTYITFRYGSPVRKGYLEVNEGLPKPLKKAMDAEAKRLKEQEKQMEEDKEYQKVFREELEKSKSKINNAMAKAQAEVISKVRENVNKKMGREQHGHKGDEKLIIEVGDEDA